MRTNGTGGTRGILTNGGSNTTNGGGSFNTENSYGGVGSLGSEEKANDDWGYPLEQTTAEVSTLHCTLYYMKQTCTR